jgi:hypothetical protein
MRNFLRQLFDMMMRPVRMFFSSPGRIFASSKRVFGVSLPARVAFFVALFLVICVVVSYFVFYRAEGRPFMGSKWRSIPVIAILVVAIPLVVYKLLKVWLEGDVSPFTDIDHAWNAGIAELKRHGLDLAETPLFLVLGSHGESGEKALFDASHLSFNVREVPVGPAALHWYGSPDGVYIVCTKVGSLSRLAGLEKKAGEDMKGRAMPAAARSVPDIRGTIVAGASGGGTSRETAYGRPEVSLAVPEPSPPQDVRVMTMDFSSHSEILGRGAAAAKPGGGRVALAPEDAIEEDRRLEYLCQLIRRARQPICPNNGILTLLPFGMLQRGQREASIVQQAAGRDLGTIHRVFKLRCPVIALVVGMEEESGFRELVRRVGHERAVNQRFGKGFDISNPPIPERLVALCAHACGAFEDSVYALFKERGALSKPGNTKLYSLLCRIRHHVHEPLSNLLESVYGVDTDKDPQAEPFLFSGCYFAAVGESEDRQAFVKAVFDKLSQEQAELQWTSAARRQDRIYQGIAQFIFALDFLLLVGLAALIGYKLFFTKG